MATSFLLDKKLARDSVLFGKTSYNLFLLMNKPAFPWIILVPQEPKMVELFDLSEEKRLAVLGEVCQVGKVMKNIFQADKINIATLGNVVSQLHIHIISRYKNDIAWPEPVWGKAPDVIYKKDALTSQIALLQNSFKDIGEFTNIIDDNYK